MPNVAPAHRGPRLRLEFPARAGADHRCRPIRQRRGQLMTTSTGITSSAAGSGSRVRTASGAVGAADGRAPAGSGRRPRSRRRPARLARRSTRRQALPAQIQGVGRAFSRRVRIRGQREKRTPRRPPPHGTGRRTRAYRKSSWSISTPWDSSHAPSSDRSASTASLPDRPIRLPSLSRRLHSRASSPNVVTST